MQKKFSLVAGVCLVALGGCAASDDSQSGDSTGIEEAESQASESSAAASTVGDESQSGDSIGIEGTESRVSELSAAAARWKTVERFCTADGCGEGKLKWKALTDGGTKYHLALQMKSDPKDGQTGVQINFVRPAAPDTGWFYYVGPSYNNRRRESEDLSMISLINITGIKFRVCRRLQSGKDKCGPETKSYSRHD